MIAKSAFKRLLTPPRKGCLQIYRVIRYKNTRTILSSIIIHGPWSIEIIYQSIGRTFSRNQVKWPFD